SQVGRGGLIVCGVKSGVPHYFNSHSLHCVLPILPASSQTRITASCERLRCFAYPFALLIAFGPAYQRRSNGRASEMRSTPRLPLRGQTSEACSEKSGRNDSVTTRHVAAVSYSPVDI